MRWQLNLEEFYLEVIFMNGSKKNVADDALSHMDKIDNVDNEMNDNKVELTLDSLSKI